MGGEEGGGAVGSAVSVAGPPLIGSAEPGPLLMARSGCRSVADGAKRLSVVDDDAGRLVEAKQPRKCPVARTDSPAGTAADNRQPPLDKRNQRFRRDHRMRGLRRNRARDPPSALEVSQFAYYALTENNDTSGFVSATDAYELLLVHHGRP